ncbi:hypothetical protein DPM19_18100 [Actinomadura craniellae]|uniref:DUF2568 domain-containing protein n=1 Tax=Actinomadura craniellae TaxID=2231787 RepID=A0A365H3C5_9ACTN|nr:hypothetical protein [Actinomadura craniellae]RAY13591.1 hypothetical protein DPM19_18100 [Actinomadura craniellae]
MSGRSVAAMPTSLLAARMLMYAVAALSALWCVAFLSGYGLTSENLGSAVVQLAPGVASLILARKAGRGGGRNVRRWIIGLQAVWILFALGRIGQDDMTGIFGFVLPIVVLVLVTRPSSREYFAHTSR